MTYYSTHFLQMKQPVAISNRSGSGTLWVMGYGKTAVAHRVCACEAYVTMIIQLTELMTLCTQAHCLQGYLISR